MKHQNKQNAVENDGLLAAAFGSHSIPLFGCHAPHERKEDGRENCHGSQQSE